MKKYLSVTNLFIPLFILLGCGNTEKVKNESLERARFEFIHQSRGETMVVETSNMEVISKVRNELTKPMEQRTLHINGALARGASGINEPWSWHFIPDQWSLAFFSMEACDAWPSYVEENLDQWLNDVGSFCPYSSRVTKELKKKNTFISTDPIPGSDTAGLGLASNISKAEFKETINEVIDLYVSLAQERGANLYLRAPGDPLIPGNEHPNDVTEENFTRDEVLERMWDINVPNAQATKNTDTNTWYLSVHGELARQSELQTESLTLIVCHEIGHFFGGFPLTIITPFPGRFLIPLASEGQADYYASQVCAKNVWQGQDNHTDRAGNKYKVLAGIASANRCDYIYTSSEERNLCYKIAYAGNLAAALWHRFQPVTSKKPSTDTPSKNQVNDTIQKGYPDPQCRLDTYFNGDLCPTETKKTKTGYDKIFYDLRKIPGIDHPSAPDSMESRDASRSLTCGTSFPEGGRPRCWFHPESYSDLQYYQD